MLKRILASSVHSAASRFFATITNLYIIYFISKKLGQELLGEYGIVFFFFIFFSSISSLNLNLYFGKELAKCEQKSTEEKILYSDFLVVSLLGIISTIVLPFAVFLVYRKISLSLLIISSVTGYFFGMERNLAGFLLGKEKMALEAVTNLISSLITIVPLFIIGDHFLTIDKIFLLRIISFVITCAMKLWYFRSGFKNLMLGFRLDFFREGKYYWFTGFSTILMRELDVLILSFFVDRSLLGAYFLALRVYFSFGILSEVIANALTPFISRSYDGKESKAFKEFNSRMMRVILWLAAFSSITLFLTRNFIVSLFSPGMVESAGHYLMYLSFLLFFRFASFFTGILLTSTEFQKPRFYISLIFSILMVVLNVTLAPLFQIGGVIISRTVVEAGMFFVLGYHVRKLFRDYGKI